MQFDDGSPNDQRPAEDAPAPSDRPKGTRRPLGRGLEEISHLFLSKSNAARESNQLRARPEGRLGVPVLRVGAPIAKSQLTATLKEYPGALHADLSVVATSVPCPPYGDIDLIAVGAAHEAIIVDVESEPGDRLLLRGLSHVDWLAANRWVFERRP